MPLRFDFDPSPRAGEGDDIPNIKTPRSELDDLLFKRMFPDNPKRVQQYKEITEAVIRELDDGKLFDADYAEICARFPVLKKLFDDMPTDAKKTLGHLLKGFWGKGLNTGLTKAHEILARFGDELKRDKGL